MRSSPACCSRVSVPVRSVTRAVSGGTATCAHAVSAANAQETALNHFVFWPKSTLGAFEISRSFSTEKFGLVL